VQHNVYPLSSGQERLWFLEQLRPGRPTYNVPLAVGLRGALDAACLERSLSEIVRRHDALRAAFRLDEGRPVQVLEDAALALRRIDFTEVPRDEQETRVRRALREEAHRPFDFGQAPLLRAALLRLAPDDHVLSLVTHHIVFDGWSANVLFRELSALYRAVAAGGPLPPSPPAQYSEYVQRQLEWLKGPECRKQLGYWQRRLKGRPSVLELPADRPRPAVQTFRGARHFQTLSPRLVRSLDDLSRREGATLFMTLLAAFQVLLARYTRQERFVVGLPVAGRSRLEDKDVIGFLVNTLALPADLSGAPGFRDLVRRTRRQMFEGMARQDVPFDRLVEALRPERDLGHMPLFQVMFAPQEGLCRELSLPGVVARDLRAHTETAKFDVTLFACTPENDGLTIIWEYSTDLFDPATIRRAAGHYRTLLEAVVDRPDCPVTCLPLLTGSERRQILRDWNDTAGGYGRDACLHQLFAAQARRTPERIAVVCGEDSLTYRELERRSNRLARHLRRHGVGPEALVGLCVDRCPDLVVAVLGILKAGGAYVPLDPAYPAERLAFMLQDAGAAVVLTQSHLADNLPRPRRAAVVRVDSDDAANRMESDEPMEADVAPDNLAYVIYTSGSTGRPKGVAIEHHSAVTLVRWAKEVFSPQDLAGVLAGTSICFDLSVFELFVPLSWGGRVVLMRDPLELSQSPRAAEVTLVNTVPSAGAELVGLGALPGSVGTVNLAGEPLPNRLAQDLYQCAAVQRVFNLYGPSEDTTYSTFTLVERGARGQVSIGRPIADTQVYIVDGRMNPVPVGVIGELYIGGEGLARGYLDRPDLTAERFVPDPLGDRPGGRLYRTGDLARWGAEGDIEFLGRVDFQVKIRGFRIELGEIEAVLSEHPTVRQACVLAREDEPGEKRLVAYVVPEGRERPGVEEWRSCLRDRLPEYMVPAAFVTMEALPLTPNGKVDRRALPLPDAPRPEGAVHFVAPRNATERAVARLWADVLGVEGVGVHDNFFDLGGHSLRATRIIACLRDELGQQVSLQTLFDHPTIAGLVQALADAEPAGVVPEIPLAASGNREAERLPLSPAQARLWFISQYEPQSPVYNVPLAMRLRGRLDVAALRRSLQVIVGRHAALRTTFDALGGDPVQVVGPRPDIPVPVTDLGDLAAEERARRARHLTALEARRPFDLEAGPLVRARLLRLGAEEHVLLLTLHHIIVDGWSLGILLRELSAVYDACSRGEPQPALPQPDVQYSDFARWHRRWLKESAEEQLAYWSRKLDGLTPLRLHFDRPRSGRAGFEGGSVSFTLPDNLYLRLRQLTHREGVTLFIVLLAAFKALLCRCTAQEDVAVGTVVANRDRPEVQGLVGFFVNTLVLRTDLSGDPTFRELLGQVRQTSLEGHAHQDLPFDYLVERLHPEREPGVNPLVQVMFALENDLGRELGLPGLEADVTEGFTGTTKFDLTFQLQDADPGLSGRVEYSLNLFREETVRRLLQSFLVLLQGAAADPDLRLSQLPLLDDAERERLLHAWNATEAPCPTDACVHDLVARVARRTPEAIAVVTEGERLTYERLNRDADRLARCLTGLGVGPEIPVGVLADRSPAMIIALLAILKAGGAYVPLDAAHPPERLGFIVRDTKMPVVLTQGGPASRLGRHGAQVLCLEDAARLETLSGDGGKAGAPAVGPDNLAYIIYTSGSTGRPKGVAVTHASLLNLVFWHRRTYEIAPEDRASQLAGLGFDASVWEIWPYLTAGATLCLPREEQRLDPEALLAWLSSQGITVAFAPTPLAERLLDLEWPDSVPLRLLLTGGDRLSRYPSPDLSFRLVNHYGPTESTVVTTAGAVRAATDGGGAPPDEGAAPSIGRPIANTRVYLLDSRLNPVPVGVPGELYIGGRGLARGYWGRPGLTAAAFVPDPFAGLPGGRLYRTGDLARRLPDGRLDFLGRVDHQVKIRGFRIELGEIEVTLAAHSGVREAVAVVRGEGPGPERLVAYVVPRPGAHPPESDELRAWLRERLPEYMVPAAIVRLDELPLTPNGKVDRRALPAPEPRPGEGTGPGIAPRTPLEERIAAIWTEVLGREPAGIDDSFFSLGGHSLLAAQVVGRVGRELGITLPVRCLFEHPTVAGLSRVAARLMQEGADREEGEGKPILPLTPAEGAAELARMLSEDEMNALLGDEPTEG